MANQFTPEIALYYQINLLAVRPDKRANTMRTSYAFLFYTLKSLLGSFMLAILSAVWGKIAKVRTSDFCSKSNF